LYNNLSSAYTTATSGIWPRRCYVHCSPTTNCCYTDCDYHQGCSHLSPISRILPEMSDNRHHTTCVGVGFVRVHDFDTVLVHTIPVANVVFPVHTSFQGCSPLLSELSNTAFN
ncbi:hypothetical protein ANCDUO_24846, partial [Ancylostoma duodenale]